MIRNHHILFIVLLLASCKGQSQPQNTHTITKGDQVSWVTNLSIPSPILMNDEVSSWSLGFYIPEFVKDSLYPLIIYLHGGIGTERTDKGEKSWEMFQFITDSLPVVIASPSGNRFAPWWSEVGAQRIFSTIDQMTSHFPIDKSKIFLAGVSDGATGAIAISSLKNSPFAGIIGSCGFPPMFGNSLDFETMKSTPIHLYISGKDRLYPADSVIQWCKERQKEGALITYTFKPLAEHGFDFKTEEKSTIISLLKKWKRTGVVQ